VPTYVLIIFILNDLAIAFEGTLVG